MDRGAWWVTVNRAAESQSDTTQRLNNIAIEGFKSRLCIKKKKSEIAQSCPTLVTPRTVTHRAPPSMGFSRQEYWNELPFPSPGDLPGAGIKPTAPVFADRFFFTTEPPGKPTLQKINSNKMKIKQMTNI